MAVVAESDLTTARLALNICWCLGARFPIRHSWEIDALNEWGRLEGLFGYLSEQKDLQRVSNGTLFTTVFQ